MKRIITILDKFNTEFINQYKPTWIKCKLNNSADLVSVAKALQKNGLRSLVTVSPTDFLDENRLEINYFFEDYITKRNCWLKCDIPRELNKCKIDSLTPYFKGASWSEREAFSMYGVKFEGHPDLRPILITKDLYGKNPFRVDFDWKAHETNQIQNIKMIVDDLKNEQFEYEKLLDKQGSDMMLNWGPAHPSSGPIRLKIHCDGEDIISVDPDIGYVWRALEHLVTKKDFIEAIVVVERLCFMDNINSIVGYAQAVEEIAKVEITEFAKWLRTLLGEVSRISSHLMGMGGFFNSMGLHTVAMWCLDIREYFLDFLESYSGARIATAAVEPGGLRWGLQENMLDELQKALNKFDTTKSSLDVVFIKNKTMHFRTKKVGCLSADEIYDYALCGIVARASGVKIDVRLDEAYAAYDKIKMDYITQKNGCAKDRLNMLYEEVEQSVDIIKQAKKRLHEGIASGEFNPTKDHHVKMPKKLPAGEALSRVEWSRGEVLYHLVTQEKGKNPYRLKIKAPSFNHTMILNHLLAGQTLSDVPLIFSSLYICQGDLDR